MMNMDAEMKAAKTQEKLESNFRNLGKGKYGRILGMCRTPTADEYKKTMMIVTAGIVLLGVVGYAIYWLMSYLPGYF